MKNKIYLAGPLFTKYEIDARKLEHKEFKKAFPNIETFAPIDAPFNGEDPSNETIFRTDYKEIKSSNIFFFDLNNMDTGTLVELGIAIEMKQTNPAIIIIGYLWDLRMSRKVESDDPYAKPWGINGFVVGGIQKYGTLVETFEDATKELKKQMG